MTEWKRPIFSIKGFDNTKEYDEKVHHIDMFYEKEWKSWALVLRNKNGDQISPAIYHSLKSQAIKDKKLLEIEYNIATKKVRK